ncbi:hypothetical protein [Saccharomonospora sp. CUA-673]|uniref:hypothetical protein n=1 Tax=Saccharomonospora sp. CUA-673 TaxID=1904969 RepID=UPI001C9E4AFD|nr:hypothetical protein [Saccharomonospora sp. CUA-673]
MGNLSNTLSDATDAFVAYADQDADGDGDSADPAVVTRAIEVADRALIDFTLLARRNLDVRDPEEKDRSSGGTSGDSDAPKPLRHRLRPTR